MEKLSKDKADKIYKLYNKLQDEEYESREYSELEDEERPIYARDYARILYSSSFRRLQGKMQILGIESTAFYRNRLTHSLEVAQIARSLARILSFKCGKEKEMYMDEECYLLDAAALAHDIGHSAFGHKGERVLDEIAKSNGLRFEGNAQNYRVLRKLDRHGSCSAGLNLTYRTLLAINKYIFDEYSREDDGKERKKFMYHEDYSFLNRFREDQNIIDERTLDVQIIEIADNIAYAVHDLEDGLALGMFNIDEILHEVMLFEDEKNKISNERRDKAACRFEKIIDEIKYGLRGNSNVNTTQEYSHLFRKKLTSKLTDEFIRSITSTDENMKTELCLQGEFGDLCSILGQTVYKVATRNPAIALYELKGEIIIKVLFNIYSDERINKNYLLLPPDYRPRKSTAQKDITRCVIDYISGMMDAYAISEFEHLTGIKYNQIDVAKIPDL